jgi:hypothetical protein
MSLNVQQDNVFFAETTTNLGVSATFTGGSRDVGDGPGNRSSVAFAAFNAFAFSDQAGTLRIEVSNDNATWRRASADQAVAAGGALYLSVPITARFHRAVFVNGGVAQTAFMLNTSYTVA